MSRFKYSSLNQIIEFFLQQGKEGECWDFKQEWHENIADLLKDIICFANTIHDENCYLIFGVNDNCEVVGMSKARRNQADIIDAISNLNFAGGIVPKISVDNITINGNTIDVLIIYNTNQTPIYLRKQYGKMREGCIYMRNSDRNTPDNGNADILDIEMLWKKRLGLTKTPLNIIYDRLYNKSEWQEQDGTYYNIFKPEYTLVISESDDHFDTYEFYSYAMDNESSIFSMLEIRYQQTKLEQYQLVTLDGGRYITTVPEWSYICRDQYGLHPKFAYKYFILGTARYRLHRFLYDEMNQEQRIAHKNLLDVVVCYKSEDERLAFEVYLEEHQTELISKISSDTSYSYIDTGSPNKTKVYKERLRTGVILNKMLKQFRLNHNRE